MTKLFEKNVGTIDRAIRLGAGIGLVIGGLTYLSAPISYVAALVGLILLFTGFTSSCTLYTLLGISTAAKAQPGPKKRR
ncbi:MAG: DUF2892 domain-containing protein [Candidatus ainarchaeum sp.]|nr:DUF2892 domain-containing protein [Candidatus ainarchaeum sp.]